MVRRIVETLFSFYNAGKLSPQFPLSLHIYNMTSPLFILASWRWPCLPTPPLCAHSVFLQTDERDMKTFHPLYLTSFYKFFPFLHILVLLLLFEFPQRQSAPSLWVPARLFTHHSGCSITISAIVALDHGLYLLFTPLSLLRCFHFLLFAFSLERREEKKESDTSSDQIGSSGFFFPPPSFMVISLQISAVSGESVAKLFRSLCLNPWESLQTAEHTSLQRIYVPGDVGWRVNEEVAKERNHSCEMKISIMIAIIIIVKIKASHVHTHAPDATE